MLVFLPILFTLFSDARSLHIPDPQPGKTVYSLQLLLFNYFWPLVQSLLPRKGLTALLLTQGFLWYLHITTVHFLHAWVYLCVWICGSSVLPTSLQHASEGWLSVVFLTSMSLRYQHSAWQKGDSDWWPFLFSASINSLETLFCLLLFRPTLGTVWFLSVPNCGSRRVPVHLQMMQEPVASLGEGFCQGSE